MTRLDSFLTMDARSLLADLGKNIKIARKRRGWTQKQLAERSAVGLSSLQRLEAGETSVGLAVLGSVLVSMDLEETLLQVASPETDEMGQLLERRRLPKRVRGKGNTLDTDF